MIVLKSEPVAFEPGGHLSPAKLVANGKHLREEHGMPMAVPTPTRMPATRPACKAVVGARLDGGEPAGDQLLRAIRVRVHSAGETIDEPATPPAAAADAGVSEASCAPGWRATPSRPSWPTR